MTLIKSISGIRGTIGGTPGDNLTPIDLVKFTSAYVEWLKEQHPGQKLNARASPSPKRLPTRARRY